MYVIYKYPIPKIDIAIGPFTLDLPISSQVLTLQIQQGVPCLWVYHDLNLPSVRRYFEWVGTGSPADHIQGARYIGTVQMYQEQLVFHLFEKVHLTV